MEDEENKKKASQNKASSSQKSQDHQDAADQKTKDEKAEQNKADEKKSTKDVKENAKQTYGSIKDYLTHLLDIRDETDRDSTMEAIIKDIPFRGHNAWILVFSIIVASIGLNVSSTAVVIGAMLISPLMGWGQLLGSASQWLLTILTPRADRSLIWVLWLGSVLSQLFYILNYRH
ncbi:MAG: hypothetical protein ACTHY4_07335 [Flavobacteriaceae bacterium]